MPPPVQNIIPLAASDRQLIEEEHARLERFLTELCDTCIEFRTFSDCHGCDRERVASCRGRLPSFFHDFHDLIAEHFDNEERIMRSYLKEAHENEYIKLHNEEHAKLMREVKQLIQEAAAQTEQGNVVAAIQQFHKSITSRFGEHTHAFDRVLLQPVTD